MGIANKLWGIISCLLLEINIRNSNLFLSNNSIFQYTVSVIF